MVALDDVDVLEQRIGSALVPLLLLCARLRRQDLEQMPIRDRKDFMRAVQRALDGLRADTSTATQKRATAAREGLLRADSARRQSLLRLDFGVVIDQVDVIQWVIDAYATQRDRRRADDEDFLVVMLAARARGYA
jgi:hypothetical protein